MNNKSLIISLCVLLIVEIGISVYLWMGRQKELARSEIFGEAINKLTSENQLLKRNLVIQNDIKTQKIDLDETITNRLGQQKYIRDILKNPLNHILYIPYNSCTSCNENILNSISDLIDLYDGELYILSASADINSITLYSKNKATHNILFFYSDTKISSDSFFDLAPYVLTVGENGEILFIQLFDDNNMKIAKDIIQITR